MQAGKGLVRVEAAPAAAPQACWATFGVISYVFEK